MEETTVFTNGSPQETGRLMREMVERYYLDMAPYASYTLPEVFDIIKSLPYREDADEGEVLMRPLLTLSMRGYGGDCDCKSIALAAYCRLVCIPFRFVAVRKFGRKSLHHVFPEIIIGGRWIAADPTYRFNSLGRERESYQERVTI